MTYPHTIDSAKADRPVLEITPEMIAAGAKVLALLDYDYVTFEEGAERIIQAALRCRFPSPSHHT